MMRGGASTKSYGFGGSTSGGPGRTLFDRSSPANAPLGRSVRGRDRGPSALSQQYNIEDEDAEGEDEDAEGDYELPPQRESLFRAKNSTAAIAEEDEEEDNDEDALEHAMEAEIERYIDMEMEEEDDDAQAGFEEEEEVGSDPGDMFMNMRHDDRPYGQPLIGDESDLMMLNTPAATDRVRKEAEDIYRRSSARFGNTMRGGLEFQFASIAKNIYSTQEAAPLTEPTELILKTEDLVCRLYNEGVGTEDNAEKMDNSLSNITSRLVRLWTDFVEDLPQPEGEDDATIGPGPEADAFEKATYIAHLVLRMHHARFESTVEAEKAPPLTEILFDWMQASHNLYPDQLREITRYKPSPACHQMFWLTLRNALLRGDVIGASQLLKNAGWEHVRKSARGEKMYIGKALENVRRFAAATCEMLDQCPGASMDWDIWNSTWTLFRVRAKGSLDRLTLFAEGHDIQMEDDFMGDNFAPEVPSISTMARKASSQIPWDIYENLQLIYGIVLGDEKAIMETAQDWCEATIGLFGWWDDSSRRRRNLHLSRSRGHHHSGNATRFGASEDYLERLSAAFHQVIQSDLNPNTMNPVEVAIASAFEGNVNGVIGLLRMWSLPVACSVSEIAALGEWLPPSEIPSSLPNNDLDIDDLALLGISGPTVDEKEGIKDATLVMYARELAGIDQMSPQRDGWEVAIQVLGRIDLPEKSEETVGELLRDLLATLDENSGTTVNKMWGILNELGMIAFAEETAEVSFFCITKQTI